MNFSSTHSREILQQTRGFHAIPAVAGCSDTADGEISPDSSSDQRLPHLNRAQAAVVEEDAINFF